MAELGYVEGQNLTYLRLDWPTLFTLPPEEAGPEIARQQQAIVDAQPDLIVVNNDTDAINARPITGDIPLVFVLSDDPVATGAVADLTAPGTNTTGSITNRHHERRLQLLTEIMPSTDKIFYMYSPLTGEAETVLKQVEAVGAALNVEVVAAPMADGPSGIEALKNVPEGVDWFFMTPYVPYDADFNQALDAVSLEKGIPIAAITDTPNASYVVGYGPNFENAYAQAADIVDRVLRGASPNDLPVQIAENFLMVNLDRAAVMNIAIPEAILRQASTIVHVGDFALTPTAPAP
jgi:putative ABC transport system substrate-binding protein